MNQGQSRYTRFKHERFVPVLSQSIRISKAPAVAKFAYYHVDLNAGGGFNKLVDVPGSPVNFLDAIKRNERDNFYAFFVDNNHECIKSLVQLLEQESNPERLAVFEADNSEVLPIVSEFIPRRERNPHYSVGSILIDPNGYHGGVPWDALTLFCREHPRFDVFMNLNIRTYRLERSWIDIATEGKWATKQLRPPSTFSNIFNREYWMWTEVCKLGKASSSWMQFVGRSIKTNQTGYESLGFYDSKSARGQRIIAEEFDGIEGDSAQFSLL